MSLFKRKNSPYWWLDITPALGQRVRESTGTSDKKAAQKYHDELKAKLWTTPRTSATTWEAACIKWLKAQERSKADAYMIKAIGFIPTISREAFDTALADKKPATYNRYRSLIKAICTHSAISIDLPKRKAPPGRLRFLTADEWTRLHAELPGHLKPIAAFALATGLRQSNVTRLTWDKVDTARKVVWIDAADTKAKKAIGIPLSDTAVAVLQAIPRENGKNHVFLYRGKPIAKIKLAWQKACVRAGLGQFITDGNSTRYDGFVFHGLRHTFASWHTLAGTDMMTLKELGGWADLQMVQRYSHLSPEHLRKAANNSVPYRVPQ